MPQPEWPSWLFSRARVPLVRKGAGRTARRGPQEATPVLRSRALVSPRSAIAALAAVATLAMSGCAGLKIGSTPATSAGGSGGGAGGQHGRGKLTAGRSGRLVTEPAGGFGAVYRLISGAR